LTQARGTHRHHKLAYVVMPIVVLVIFTYCLLLCQVLASTTNTNILEGVGVRHNDVLMLLQNGVTYDVRISSFTAFSAFLVNRSTAVAFGMFGKHPALALILATSNEYAPHTVIYYVPTYYGAIFSGIVEGRHDTIGVGYIKLNSTYAGAIIHINLSNGNHSASVYTFGAPVYFRDAIVYGNNIAVATGIGFGGEYYPAVTLISGSNARIIALNPRIGGLEGFAVKAVATVQNNSLVILALRGRKVVLVSLTRGGFHAFTPSFCRGSGNVELVTHPRDWETVVILRCVTPFEVLFPYMNATALPLAARYYVTLANGSITVFGPEHNVLTSRWRPLKFRLRPLKLEGFDIVEYVTKSRLTNVTALQVRASVKAVNTLTRMPESSSATSVSSQKLSTHVLSGSPGFTAVNGNEGRGLLLLVIGCVMIFASFLLKKFLNV